MTQEEIIEYNDLIAFFDKKEHIYASIPNSGTYVYINYDQLKEHKALGYLFFLEYHSSWDWQIPVWSKLNKEISKTAFQTITIANWIELMYSGYYQSIDNNEPQEGFKLLVTLIKWYNQQPK